MLLQAGADPTTTDAYGRTPLHYASGAGRRDLVRILIEAGANPKVEDDEHRTPWDDAHRAYYEGNNHDARLVLQDLREAGGAPTRPPSERPPEAEPAGIAVGSEVTHAKFGPGEVKAVAGEGEQAKITVVFASGGEKTLLARFLKQA